jgi:hypothetical protein
MALLIFAAIGPARQAVNVKRLPLAPPSPWLLGVGAAIAAALWYGLCLLAFGLKPTHLYGKIALDAIATVLLIWLGARAGRKAASGAATTRAA